TAAAPGGRSRRLVLAAGLVLALLGAVWGALLVGRRSGRPQGAAAPVDPRLAYAGPYRNVRPDVGYVGDGACAGCHQRQAATYREHPMGRSLAPVTQATPLPPRDAGHHNPFDALGLRFEVVRDGGRLLHRQTCRDA